MQTFRDIIAEACGSFETRLRADETAFTTTREGAPEWVAHLVREAHGEFLPEDWRYQCIRAALDHMQDAEYADADSARDGIGEFADGHVDTYTADRLRWAASHTSRVGYCDSAAEDFGTPADVGLAERVGAGQYVEAEEVYGLVVDALEERLAELELQEVL